MIKSTGIILFVLILLCQQAVAAVDMMAAVSSGDMPMMQDTPMDGGASHCHSTEPDLSEALATLSGNCCETDCSQCAQGCSAVVIVGSLPPAVLFKQAVLAPYLFVQTASNSSLPFRPPIAL